MSASGQKFKKDLSEEKDSQFSKPSSKTKKPKSHTLLAVRITNIILLCIFFSFFLNTNYLSWDEACYISNSFRILGKTTIFEQFRPQLISILGIFFGYNILIHKIFAFALIPALYLTISLILQKSIGEKYKNHLLFYETFLLFSFITFTPLYELTGLFLVELFSVIISFFTIILLSKVELNSINTKNYPLALFSGIVFTLLCFARYPYFLFLPVLIGYFALFGKKNKWKLILNFVIGFLVTFCLLWFFYRFFLGIRLFNSFISGFFEVENEFAYLYSEGFFYYITSLKEISLTFLIMLILAIADLFYILIAKFLLKKEHLDNKIQRLRLLLIIFFIVNLFAYSILTHKEIRFLMYMFFYLICHFSILISRMAIFLRKRGTIKKALGNIITLVLLSAILLSLSLTFVVNFDEISTISKNVKANNNIKDYNLEEKQGYVFFVPDPRYSLMNPDKKVNPIYASSQQLHWLVDSYLNNTDRLIEKGYFDAPCAVFIYDSNSFPVSDYDTNNLKALNESLKTLKENSYSVVAKAAKTIYELCR